MSKREVPEHRSPDHDRVAPARRTAPPPSQPAFGAATPQEPAPVRPPQSASYSHPLSSSTSSTTTAGAETFAHHGSQSAAPTGPAADSGLLALLTRKDALIPTLAPVGAQREARTRFANRLVLDYYLDWAPPASGTNTFDGCVSLLRFFFEKMRHDQLFEPPPLVATLDDDELRTILGLNERFASLASQIIALRVARTGDDVHQLVQDFVNFVCHVPETAPAIALPSKSNSKEVIEAWRAPLRGLLHLSLLAALREAHLLNARMHPDQHYTNNVTMLQSSGTGKSRNVHEMSKYILLILFILRAASDTTGYPQADAAVRDFLVVLPGANVSEQTYRAKVRLLLQVAFLSVCAWLGHHKPPAPPADAGIDVKSWNYLYMVNAWRIFLSLKRTEIYTEIVAGTEKMPASQDDSTTALEAALSTLVYTLKSIPLVDTDESLVPPFFRTERLLPAQLPIVIKATKAAIVDIKESGLRLPSLADESPELLVLLAFDEAQGLTQSALGRPGTDLADSPPLRSKSAYDAVLAVLNDLRSETAGLFLSTSMKIGQFAPPAALAPSARQVTSKRLQAPITELPFDCYLEKGGLRVGSPELALDNLSTVSFMAKFGRPLYGSWFVNAGNLDPRQRLAYEDKLIELVRGKLDGGVPRTSSDLDSCLIAALDVRIHIEYEPRRSSVIESHPSNQVAGNMRWAVSVPEHRLYFHSMYPSEPVMSEAAATLMCDWMTAPTPWSPVSTLVEMMRQGAIDLGERGELTARLLMTLAYDRAMRAANPGEPRVWRFSKGCQFLQFIDALFGEANARSLRASRPDNVPSGELLSAAFEHSIVRFTHFVKLGDKSGLTTTALCAAFIRGMAFIGSTNQARVDLIIPVLLNSKSVKHAVCPANMTALLIQVKRRLKPGSDSSYDYRAEQLGVFRDSDDDDRWNQIVSASDRRARPYCTLLMELATYLPDKDKPAPTTPPKKGQTAAQPTPSGLAVKEAAERVSKRIQVKQDTTKPHPRYNIKAYGCSHSVYDVIDIDNNGLAGKAKYSQLLGTRDFADEHPRKELLPLVWQAKPKWVSNKKTNSYEWFDATVIVDSEDFEDESQDGVHATAYGEE